MNGCRLFDDQSIFDKFADILSRVSITDLCCLIGIKPDLALTTLEHRGS